MLIECLQQGKSGFEELILEKTRVTDEMQLLKLPSTLAMTDIERLDLSFLNLGDDFIFELCDVMCEHKLPLTHLGL